MEGERVGETSICERISDLLPLAHAPTGTACNPGMCPDWELNWRPYALQDDTQPTEPHWSGQSFTFLLIF